jgi:phosphoserine phosphatase
MNQRLILLTMTGPDRPGIIAAVTGQIAEAGARIRDIEQTVTHTLLSLSIVIDFPTGESDNKPLIKELLYLAKETGLDLDFSVLGEADYRRKSTRDAHVVTMMGGEVNALAIARVGKILAEHGVNIERVSKLNQGDLRCVELMVTAPDDLDMRTINRQLLHAGANLGVDIAVQRENLYRRAKRLVVMDMDSTLIQIEVIDELARIAGVGEQVARITERAMNGELDFPAALRERVALLSGLPAAALEEVYRNIPFTPGAKTLIRVLKRLGFKTAVISGGFSYFADRIKDDLGLDYAYANVLEIVDGFVTGRVIGQVVDGGRKAELLEEIAAKEGVTLDQAIAIGDGANDLPMLGKAGLGIAFNAKARVREEANYHINQQRLDSILYLLGISEREMAEICA